MHTLSKRLTRTQKKVLYGTSAVILAVGLFVAGVCIGWAHRPYVSRVMGVDGVEAPASIPTDFEPFWKVWNMIDEKYPGADEITAQERVYGAIKGLVASTGDPYSTYFPPEETMDFEKLIRGDNSFEGIGMEVGIKDNVLTVVAPLKATPAEAAGIKAGDKILKIDDTVTTDMSVDKAVDLIRGPAGTVVRLTIYHEGSTGAKELSVTRGRISIPTLDATLRADGVYVIALYSFDATSANLMTEALEDFAASGASKLVIDLRGNPGGFLDSAVNIASYFLPQGTTVVTEDFGKNGSPRVYRSKGFTMLDMEKVKIAILVDKGSASASEILAGALSEHGVAALIGQTTYGKGSVQEVLEVTNDTALKITVAKWLTPHGISISEKGLTPTIPVTPSTQAGSDAILERAVQYLQTGH